MNIGYYFRYMDEAVPYLLYGILAALISGILFWSAGQFSELRNRYQGIDSDREWRYTRSDKRPSALFFNFFSLILSLAGLVAVVAAGLSFVYFLMAGLQELSIALVVGLVVLFYVVRLVADFYKGPAK